MIDFKIIYVHVYDLQIEKKNSIVYTYSWMFQHCMYWLFVGLWAVDGIRKSKFGT